VLWKIRENGASEGLGRGWGGRGLEPKCLLGNTSQKRGYEILEMVLTTIKSLYHLLLTLLLLILLLLLLLIIIIIIIPPPPPLLLPLLTLPNHHHHYY
jgi:hypothetical protein